MRIWYCHSIFCFLVVLYLYCFFFLCVSICHFSLVLLKDVFLSFLFFNVSCLYSRFMFCCYHEICIKYLIHKIVFFSADSILSSFTYMASVFFLFPFYVFVVSNYPLCCVCSQIEVALVIFMPHPLFYLYATISV